MLEPTGQVRSGSGTGPDGDFVPGSIIGVDEAGRGCLAGPVVAGAVLFPPRTDPSSLVPGLDDSKKLSPQKRARLARLIREHALSWGVGYAWQDEIDAVNILNATFRAMSRAVFQLVQSASASGAASGLFSRDKEPEAALVLPRLIIDGTQTIPLPEWRLAPRWRPPAYALTLGLGREEFPEPLPGLPPQTALKQADSLVPEVSAASILAKTMRDALMDRLDPMFAGYGFAGHKGYGTAEHLEALTELGPCPLHRKTFAKVRPERQQLSLLGLRPKPRRGK